MRLRNRDARVEALRNVSVFSGLPKSDLELLARHTGVVERPAGTVLCEEGRLGRQLIYLDAGTARVESRGRTIATLGPGDVIGELSLIDGAPASATVTLTDDSHLLVMSLPDFQTVMANSPNFHLKLLKALARRLRETDKQLVG